MMPRRSSSRNIRVGKARPQTKSAASVRFDASATSETPANKEDSRRRIIQQQQSVPEDVFNSLSLSFDDTISLQRKAPEPPLTPPDRLTAASSYAVKAEVMAPMSFESDNTDIMSNHAVPMISDVVDVDDYIAQVSKPPTTIVAQPTIMSNPSMASTITTAPSMASSSTATASTISALSTTSAGKKQQRRVSFQNNKKKAAPVMTEAQKQQKAKQEELNKLCIMYGVDPTAIKPEEIPLWEKLVEKEAKEAMQKSASNDDDDDHTETTATATVTTVGSSSKVASPERETSVKFMVDPDVNVGGSSRDLSMPELPDDDQEGDETLKLSPRTSKGSLAKTKSSSAIGSAKSSDDAADHKQQRPDIQKSASMPSNLSSSETKQKKKKDRSWEQEWMMEAQRSLASLSPDAMQELIKIVSKESSSTNMEELMKDTPKGSFIVESEPGMYHRLDPKTLLEFVASRDTTKRKHQVGGVTILKEDHQDEASSLQASLGSSLDKSSSTLDKSSSSGLLGQSSKSFDHQSVGSRSNTSTSSRVIFEV